MDSSLNRMTAQLLKATIYRKDLKNHYESS